MYRGIQPAKNGAIWCENYSPGPFGLCTTAVTEEVEEEEEEEVDGEKSRPIPTYRPKICNDQEALQVEGRLACVLERTSTFEHLRTEQHAALFRGVLASTGLGTCGLHRISKYRCHLDVVFVSLRPSVPVGAFLVSPLVA